MFLKFLYRGLPMSVLLLSAALLQGLAIRAFAHEGVRAETIVAAEPEQRDCRPVERLGGKVKIRKAECRGRP